MLLDNLGIGGKAKFESDIRPAHRNTKAVDGLEPDEACFVCEAGETLSCGLTCPVVDGH